jgi:serine protease AprX
MELKASNSKFVTQFLKVAFAILFIINIAGNLTAQNRYWVFFTDKNNVSFNPYNYFDQKAIERRVKAGISLYDSTDFPLNSYYVAKVAELAEKVNCQLRWFNAISISTDEDQLFEIERLPFVKKIAPSTLSDFVITAIYDTVLREDEEKLWVDQLERMQGGLFTENGYTGKGIRIAVFDAGFPGVDKIPVFEHLRKNNQIKLTWDFARKKPYVYANNPHGTMVLSCIAGRINGKNLGLATDAEFLLARTEIERESKVEEEYWLQAMEWADKNGADIINSSLAYTYERYNTFEMNGRTSLVSMAANMAANKGILVVNAMGNDGNHDWKIMATPADADSVLSVGAISPLTDFHAGFSSYGPTANYRLKPNVVAFGRAIVAGKDKLEKVKGTSFSAPLITGFAACAWQKMNFLTNVQLFEKIQESSHLFPYFDYAHGYGVPQASYFVTSQSYEVQTPTFEFIESGDTVFIEVKKEFIDKNYFKNTNYLFYHIENNSGYLEDYWLVDVYKERAAIILKEEYSDGKVLRAHYKGFTDSFRLK